MVTKLEARNAAGAVLALTVADTNDGIIIEDIEGLDPVKATLVTSTFAGLDGEQYQTSRREGRDIVLKLGLEGSYGGTSARALRDKLYKWFMPKSEVNLRFYSADNPTVYIVGRVESFNAPLFVQEPTATISIHCFNSDFLAVSSLTVSGQSAASLGSSILQINNDASLEMGMILRLTADRTISAFDIVHRGEDGVSRTMEFDLDMVSGQYVRVTTTPGAKGVVLFTPNQSTRSALYSVSPSSIWTLLTPGMNELEVLSPGAGMSYTVEMRKRYGGL